MQDNVVGTEERPNQRFSRMESILDNLVAYVIDPRAMPLPAMANPMAQSPQPHDGRTNVVYS